MTTTMRSGIRIVAAMAVAAVISMSAGSAGAQVAGSTTIGENRQAQEPGHVQHTRGGGTSRACGAVLQAPR
jgi:hypothetical protein